MRKSETVEAFDVGPFALRCLDASWLEWNAALHHPFLAGMVSGTLPPEKFRYYQMQDARYLEAYVCTCEVLSGRFESKKEGNWFAESARLALSFEQQLHDEYGHVMGFTRSDVAEIELASGNRAYQQHVLERASGASLIEAVSALTPCAWLYADIGVRIAKKMPAISESNPFGNWLRTYFDPTFITFTNEMLFILERLAGEHAIPDQNRAIEAFHASVRYERMFWDQAWASQTGSIR